MDFFRALNAEVLKLRRTLALAMVFVCPLLIVALQFMIQFDRLGRPNPGNPPQWDQLIRNIAGLWVVLMLPLYLTLETALLGALEHSESQWRNLFTLPVARSAIYFSKLIVATVMLAVSHLALAGGIYLSGKLLALRDPRAYTAGFPLAMAFSMLGTIFVLALLIVVLHHAISLHWHSFTVATGAGISATVINFIVVNSKYGIYYPWSLPVQPLSPQGVQGHSLIYSCTGALIVAALSSWHFSRRDVS